MTDNGICERVREYFAANLLADVPDDQNIFQAGMVNSLFAVQLVTFVEEEFGLVVEDDEMEIANFRSVDAITAYVALKGADRAAKDVAP